MRARDRTRLGALLLQRRGFARGELHSDFTIPQAVVGAYEDLADLAIELFHRAPPPDDLGARVAALQARHLAQLATEPIKNLSSLGARVFGDDVEAQQRQLREQMQALQQKHPAIANFEIQFYAPPNPDPAPEPDAAELLARAGQAIAQAEAAVATTKASLDQATNQHEQCELKRCEAEEAHYRVRQRVERANEHRSAAKRLLEPLTAIRGQITDLKLLSAVPVQGPVWIALDGIDAQLAALGARPDPELLKLMTARLAELEQAQSAALHADTVRRIAESRHRAAVDQLEYVRDRAKRLVAQVDAIGAEIQESPPPTPTPTEGA